MSGTRSQKQTSKEKKVTKSPISAAMVEEEQKALEYFIGRLQDYSVVFSNDGNYYDLVDGAPHPRNEMACLFRWDYINNNVGALKGNALHKSIDRFLSAAEQAFRNQMTKPENNEYVIEQEGFMKKFNFPPLKK